MAQVRKEALDAIKKWQSEAGFKGIAVGIDIGATNTRVGISPAQPTADSAAYEILYSFEADDAETLYSNLSFVAKSLPIPSSCSCIDAAGPILEQGTKVIITNWPENHNREILVSHIDERICPHSHTALLNDLEAACHGVLGLSGSNRISEFFVPLNDAKQQKKDKKVCASRLEQTRHLVLAMGTGLGVGLLLIDPKGKFTVVPVEIGHTLVTQFGTEYKESARDQAFVSWLGQKLYSGQHIAEFEDICSGRGLRYAYEFACLGKNQDPSDKSPKDIAILASKGDEIAIRAMKDHYKFLFRVAQNCCVGLQTKGVILAGDNQVANHWFVDSNAEIFSEEFIWHPKQKGGKDHWLENIPFFIQNKTVNTNMIGDIHVAQSLLS